MGHRTRIIRPKTVAGWCRWCSASHRPVRGSGGAGGLLDLLRRGAAVHLRGADDCEVAGLGEISNTILCSAGSPSRPASTALLMLALSAEAKLDGRFTAPAARTAPHSRAVERPPVSLYIVSGRGRGQGLTYADVDRENPGVYAYVANLSRLVLDRR